jgi:hypothetical protein
MIGPSGDIQMVFHFILSIFSCISVGIIVLYGANFHIFWPKKNDFDIYKGFLWEIWKQLLDFYNMLQLQLVAKT